MKKNFLVGLMCPVLALASVVSPVFAATELTGKDADNTNKMEVSYMVADSGWKWSIPATFAFANAEGFKKADKVTITAGNGSVLQLPVNKQIQISMASNTGYNMQRDNGNGGKSQIKYHVYKGTKDTDTEVTNGMLLLEYVAGRDSNLSNAHQQDLLFKTSAAEIQNATVMDKHADELTFTAAVGTYTPAG